MVVVVVEGVVVKCGAVVAVIMVGGKQYRCGVMVVVEEKQ